MKFVFRSLVLAPILVMATHAQAQSATGDLTVHNALTAQGWNVSRLAATTGAFSFSSSFITAANTMGVFFSALSPASVSSTLTTRGRYSALSFSAPVAVVRAELGTNTLTLLGVALKGGMEWYSENDDLTSSGGYLAIRNLGVNLATRTIYGDIDGGNGVGSLDQVALWNVGSVDGPTTFQATEGPVRSSLRLTGLYITPTAYNLLRPSLGAFDQGMAALNRVTDYGVLTIDFGANMHYVGMPITASVPEPESAAYALIALGLMGLAARRRNSRA